MFRGGQGVEGGNIRALYVGRRGEGGRWLGFCVE